MDDTVIAVTTSGKVEGLDNDGALQFRGIPFALAERFRAPQPVEPWESTRAATRFGPVCPQNPSPLETMLGARDLVADEDCLALNVFTPACDDGARPVMVWIHGGGFTAGAGSIPWYSGTRLASRYDVVVVTINYRLGVFGFLGMERLGAEFAGSGNNGIRDQIAALEWVRDNIAGFGGDPGRVTIFGESAGGMSVATLLGTPAAEGLFHAAIPQSGAASNVHTPVAGGGVVDLLLRELGVPAEALLELDVATLLAAQRKVGEAANLGRLVSADDGSATLLPFQPVVDGVVLSEPPLARVRAGKAAGVPVLVGTTAEEWNLFEIMARLGESGLSDDALRRRIARAVGESRADAAVEVYRSLPRCRTNHDVWGAFATDWIFRIPAIRLAEAQQGAGGRAWMYRFSYRSSAFGGAMGAAHAVDVPFGFDNVHRNGVAEFLGGVDDGVRLLSARTSRAWTTLARDGSPGHDDLPEWPEYEPGRRATMDLDAEPALLDDPDAAQRSFW